MTPRDISNKKPWREYRSPVQDAPSPESPAYSCPEELDIEKRWLLLARIDPEQFGYFFDKYHDRIYVFAAGRTGDAELAADITNAVFTTAWQMLGRFRWQGCTFGAWLFALARGEISNALRKKSRQKEQEFQPDRDDRRVVDTPDRILDRKRDDEILQDCLKKLSPDRHEIFVLHFWVGLAIKQVATVMNMPENTVRSHLSRGRRQLLNSLSGHEDRLSDSWQHLVRQMVLKDSELHLVDPQKDVPPQGGEPDE